MEQQSQNISEDNKLSLLRKSSSTGSGGSGGSGNNSDNSAICSLGYNSFGFNFDVEDGIMANDEQESAQAAETAVSNLAAIANDIQDAANSSLNASQGNASNESTSMNATVVTKSTEMSDGLHGRPSKKQKTSEIDEDKREERNAREKERSFRISRQINELRNLLSAGGVIVPKGTKSSVLTEAANYIRMLQQHQYRSEIDRHQLVQQMQMIGSGALGPQAAQAIRHVAAQNGVWSLGNFGGVPPKSALSFYSTSTAPPTTTSSDPNKQESPPVIAPVQTTLEDHEYRFIFNSCSVGMAIASMGGAFIDCNQLFCQISSYSKQEVCAMTIFNLTSREDLQHAFDLISQMISPPIEGRGNSKPIVLRGTMKSRNDIGLSVSLIKGDEGIAKCFCVTLIKNPSSPFDTSKPVPAIAGLVPISSAYDKDMVGGLNSAPAYTTG